jgi:hypothetical protein
VEGVVRLGEALIRSGRRGVDFSGTLHAKGFVRPLAVVLLNECIELGLPLKEVGSGGECGFLLEREVHALVAAVLLRMTGANAFDANAQAQPPHREAGKVEQSVGRGEGNAAAGTNGARQTPFFEKTLEGRQSGLFPVGLQGLAQQ